MTSLPALITALACGVIAFMCLVTGVLLLATRRLFGTWPELQVTISAFGWLFLVGGWLHGLRATAEWYPRPILLAGVTTATAGMIVVASMFLFNLVQGRPVFFREVLTKAQDPK